MGTQYSSDIPIKRTTEGIPSLFVFYLKIYQIHKSKMKVFMIAALCIAAVSADPWGYFGYGYGHPGLLKNPHLSWPGVVAPGFESTCFGCRGKRSADAEPTAEADAYYGYGGYGRYGYGGYGYGRGYGYGGYGHYLGKRSADAEAEPHLGYYGYPYAYGYYPYGLHHVAKVAPLAKAGVAGHPTGTSFVARSPQGLRGKRSAEPWGYGYPYGFYGYPYHYGAGVAGHVGGGTSYVARSPQGLGK